jgi:hypothetical protein
VSDLEARLLEVYLAYPAQISGDVVELGDTLVLETSASCMRVRLSPSPPNLSQEHGSRRPVRQADVKQLRAPRAFRRTWVCWGDWMPYRAVNPALLASIEGSNPSTPTRLLLEAIRRCANRSISFRRGEVLVDSHWQVGYFTGNKNPGTDACHSHRIRPLN